MENLAQKFSYESMGTTWEITFWEMVGESQFEKIKEEIMQKSKFFDEAYSRFIKTSLVWQLSQKIGVVEVPEDFMNMLRWYMALYEPSEKKLNPLIGFTISDLGYDENYSLKTKDVVRPTPDLQKTVRIVDDKHIQLSEPVLFDLGALGKGYFVDVIEKYLSSQGYKHFLVNGSGDISYRGPTPIQVGLEHPLDTTKVIGVIDMPEGCMCSSGTNRRKWGNYNHVIDPHTSTSPQEIIATWVIAPTTVQADALASCLFFVPPENFEHTTIAAKFAPFGPFEYCIMNKDSQIKRSPGFKATFY